MELPLRGPLQANLPAPKGVRTKRSKGPYLSYEMDQVRIVGCAGLFIFVFVVLFCFAFLYFYLYFLSTCLFIFMEFWETW